jgi:hypothetical protein
MQQTVRNFGTHYPEPETASTSSSTNYYSWELCLRETGLVSPGRCARTEAMVSSQMSMVMWVLAEPKIVDFWEAQSRGARYHDSHKYVTTFY